MVVWRERELDDADRSERVSEICMGCRGLSVGGCEDRDEPGLRGGRRELPELLAIVGCRF